MQLKSWLRIFAHGNLMVVPFEAYIRDRPATIAKIRQFLEIDPAAVTIPTDRSFNQAADLPVSTPLWRRLVFNRSWYRYHVKPSLPRALRERAARLLLPRAPSAPEALSPASTAWLRAELAGDVRRLRQLFPDVDFPWPDFPIEKVPESGQVTLAGSGATSP